eukprot:SAG31_NODE_36978_length_308_cov_1.191388_1_plen_34_part_01
MRPDPRHARARPLSKFSTAVWIRRGYLGTKFSST